MTKQQAIDALGDLLRPCACRCEEDLRRYLIEPHVPEVLAEAMRYCVLDGGKRLRPAMVYMAAEAVGKDGADELTSRAAVAVELAHCYSLVHDDLPAMDDDTLRRGRPTAHVKFGEAMAVLAGDAMLTRAFGVLLDADDPLSGRLAAELAGGAGPAGMIAGQVADMGLCELPDGPEGLRYIHLHKTADLIRTSARMGAICGEAPGEHLAAISEYAEKVGLLFQLVDDLLDVTGDAQKLGKTPGKDASSGKRTHVAELGIEASRSLCRGLTDKAVAALGPLGEKAEKLARLAALLAQRTH